MAPQVLRKCCVRCGKGFLTHSEELIYCNTTCEGLHKYEMNRKIKKKYNKHFCLSCGGGLNGVRKFCDRVCKNAYNKAETEQDRIIEANKKEAKPSKKRGCLSYEELNRRSEYKRLYDDFHIRRQIRGISRDLI